jgi:hypothetical protein
MRHVTLLDVSVHVMSSDCISPSRILAMFGVIYFMERSVFGDSAL